jgi:hypothetical protein
MTDSPALKFIIQYYLKVTGYPATGRCDSGGRWYPEGDEKVSCCKSIREPSRSFPWSYYKHSKSAKHIRNRVLERPTMYESEALAMTMETAPLYVNYEGLLLYVCKKLMGE